jgi:adenine-specific DNA-methyltransferase
MSNNQKLELTWIGKEKRPKLEPRILIEDPDKSYGDRHTENMLIFGDNLLALKALEQNYTGSVKCIFIDPPYNTGSAFTHYDDGLEHSIWLTMMRDRLEILRRLLAEDGSIWITIDDNEAHYLKVLCDEVFGRGNFIGNAIWEKADSPRMDAQFFSVRHDHLLVYAKNNASTIWNKIYTDAIPEHYDKLDASGKRYYLKPLRAMGGQGDSRATRPTLYYALVAPDGTEIFPKRQDGTDGAWRWNENKVTLEKERIDWVKGRNGWTVYYRIYADENGQRPPETIWTHADVGSNRTSKAEIKALFPDSVPFGTPKPERLLRRVIEIATNPGDFVLDSFSGSGTTGAVGHKIGRKWIMIELGEHCHTHILPRMKKVCDGTDQGGISKAVNWQGGGGFKYYYMAPSLLTKDRYDQWVINADYNAPMLAAAMAKHENFRYSPDEVHYWKQGQSSEKDFIFTTTVHLTPEHLDRIHEEMQPGESLLICCKSHFRGADGKYDNITVKKIPSMLLGKCEFGRDDYSLNIVDMPLNGKEPEFVPAGPPVMETKKEKRAKGKDVGQISMFESEVR